MGYKLKRIFVGQLCENEEREIPVELEEEKGAAIHGVVKFPDHTPVKGAVVKLFKKVPHDQNHCDKHHCDLIPVTFSFTDECGQFLFGIPEEEMEFEYVVKVFFYKKECIKPCPIPKKTAYVEE